METYYWIGAAIIAGGIAAGHIGEALIYWLAARRPGGGK